MPQLSITGAVCIMLRPSRKLMAAVVDSGWKPLRPFLLERFDGWNDSTMSLSSSECEPLSLSELLDYADDEGKERWDKLGLGYVEPSSGSRYLRQEILRAQFDTRLLDEDCVNVCAPQEGIFLAVLALCSPGDHVVVVAPAYQSLHEIASSLGCEVSSWWPEEDDIEIETASHHAAAVSAKSFCFRPESLRELIRPNQTKLVVANFPHNPTGALPTQEEFAEMVGIVQESDCWFLVDEMYRGLEHPQQGKYVAPLPPVADCMPKGVSLGGVSKSYGLPGLRIGWLVNRDVRFQKRVAELKDYTTICPAGPSEALAFMALRSQVAILTRSRKILEGGLPVLRQFIADHQSEEKHPDFSLTWSEPKGGTFAWVGYQSNVMGLQAASQYCDRLRQGTGLMIVPSCLFTECQASDDRIRLTYGKKGLRSLLELWKDNYRE